VIGKQKKGVTLFELLIVVILLGVLSAVAIPRISKSSTNAKSKTCDTNVDVINTAIEMYHAEIGSYPASAAAIMGNTTYFPDGAPACPFGTAYLGNSDISRVVLHSH